MKYGNHQITGRSQAFWAQQPSRRGFLKQAGAAALTVGAAGVLPQAARASTAMTMMCWEGYNDPRIIDAFMAENDVSLAIDLIVDSPAGFAKLASGASRDVDLVASDVPWVQRMGPAQLCEYLDEEEFADVFKTYYPQFQPPFAPLLDGDKITGIPTRWGWVGPTVNTQTSKVEDWRSYDACFDSKNKDKIGIMDWGDWPIMPMALHAGVNPYEVLDENALNEVRLVLRALFKNSRALFSDLSLSQKALLDGSVTTLIGTGTYVTSGLRFAGYDNILTVVPEAVNGFKKGIIWIEGTAIVKDPVDIELAKKLLRRIASKEAGYVLSVTELTCNPSPNMEVADIYTPAEKAVLQLDYSDTVWENSVLHNVAPNIDDMLAIWQEELASAN